MRVNWALMICISFHLLPILLLWKKKCLWKIGCENKVCLSSHFSKELLGIERIKKNNMSSILMVTQEVEVLRIFEIFA